MAPDSISMMESNDALGSGRSECIPARYVRFGPFHVDQSRQEIFQNGLRLKLQGKVYQVLVCLLERPGDVVTREELRQKLWPADSHVNYDANVNTTVNKLRQVLGDSTDKPVYIETIPRKGYSFIAQPEFSQLPFPKVSLPLSIAPNASADDSPSPQLAFVSNAAPKSPRLTLIIGALIVAGMLVGAAVATLWLAHATHP